jgi:hypothetical protein
MPGPNTTRQRSGGQGDWDVEERGRVFRQDGLPILLADNGKEVLESIAAVVVRMRKKIMGENATRLYARRLNRS